jgi:hypothetical protein
LYYVYVAFFDCAKETLGLDELNVHLDTSPYEKGEDMTESLEGMPLAKRMRNRNVLSQG